MINKIIIKKRKGNYNLNDYKNLIQFDWQKAVNNDIDFKKVNYNAASYAVDLNALNYRKNKIALYWEGETEEEVKYTFAEISVLSSRFSQCLRKIGIVKYDRVFIFLPRWPELYISFLGIIKSGAIAGTLFSAFGPQALLDRLNNAKASLLITNLSLFSRIKPIWKKLPFLKKIILVDDWNRDSFLKEKKLLKRQTFKNCLWFYDILQQNPKKAKICKVKPDDPAFILYTSGTTGKPKGIIHSHQVCIYQKNTAFWVLDIKENDVYWCTADPGWVTGIAYEILGTWALGASTLIYSGRFDPKKWYQLIDEYQVNVWYTAPTAIRMLAANGLELVKKYNLSSLRHLASVGEPLNPEAVYWGLKAFGLPFHDNYWQTETGGIMIANYPFMNIKPGSMGKPVPGIKANIVDDNSKPLKDYQIGNLVFKPNWPGIMKKIWKRPKKYRSYFKNGWYFTGDLAYKDKDGYFWFVSRSDDLIKTSGERVGPFEVESALVSHPKVAEAGVIGIPDKVRGEIIKAFIVLKKEFKGNKKLKEELKEYVKSHLAGHAYPREIEFIDKLPKTRSGKIMRRVLKAKELGLELGDTSTLEDF